MKIKTLLLAVCLCITALLGCCAKNNEEENGIMGNQILVDAEFKNGFGVMGIQNGADNLDGVDNDVIINNSNYTVYNHLNYGGKATGKYFWRLAQWGTKEGNSFASSENYTFTDLGDEKYSYVNKAKAVTVDTKNGEITLAVDAGKEFDSPRVNGQLWPHLLIEQVFKETETKRSLSGMRKLVMRFNGRIDECTNLMTKEEYNSSLHAAQCSWYLTLNSSKGNKGYIWFGLPIFDNRNAGEFLGGTVFFDNGLSTGTGQLIYALKGEVFLKKGVDVGDEISVNVDVFPYLRDALLEAQKRGLFLDHTINDFEVGTTNIGWEVPGTFKCSMTISNLGLIYE